MAVKSISTKSRLLASLVVFCCVLVPFLFWQDVWFGRALTDQELENFLSRPENSRQIQHALAQISERIQRGDHGVGRWYGRVVQLAEHPIAGIRNTAAWVMGQDPDYLQFRHTLQVCLQDEDALVRRNAALSLVRFGDGSSRLELRQMLVPSPVLAPVSGRLSLQVEQGEEVRPDILLFQVAGLDQDSSREVRASIPGVVGYLSPAPAGWVEQGQTVLILQPDRNHVWEALRGFYLIGKPEDLPFIEAVAENANWPQPIRNQARLAMDAIRRHAAGQ